MFSSILSSNQDLYNNLSPKNHIDSNLSFSIIFLVTTIYMSHQVYNKHRYQYNTSSLTPLLLEYYDELPYSYYHMVVSLYNIDRLLIQSNMPNSTHL
jgi:hypothetical protein